MGRITKAGNEQIRMLLVLGATSMAQRAGQWNSAAGAWIRGVLARRPARLATVALAAGLAVSMRAEHGRGRGGLSGPFGSVITPLDDALDFIVTGGFFWTNA